MPKASRLAILIAAILAHLAFAVPGSAAELPFHAEGSDCCDADCCADDRCADRTEPGDTPDDDCCPSGCDHCPLPCCGGGTALLGVAALALPAPPAVSGVISADEPGHRGSDPRGIYHPPRA